MHFDKKLLQFSKNSASIGKYFMKRQLHTNLQICKCSIRNDFNQLWKDFTAVSLELCKSIYFERPMKGDDFGLNPLVPIHMLIRKYKFTAKTKDLRFLISTNLSKIASQQKIVLDTILDRHIFQILCASSQGPKSSQTTLTRRSGQVVQKS